MLRNLGFSLIGGVVAAGVHLFMYGYQAGAYIAFILAFGFCIALNIVMDMCFKK